MDKISQNPNIRSDTETTTSEVTPLLSNQLLQGNPIISNDCTGVNVPTLKPTSHENVEAGFSFQESVEPSFNFQENVYAATIPSNFSPPEIEEYVPSKKTPPDDSALEGCPSDVRSKLDEPPVCSTSQVNITEDDVKGNLQEISGNMKNLQFYKNMITAKPNREHIEEILHSWRENYNALEYNHSYIQWLFPLPEVGRNHHAQALTEHEREIMMVDEEVQNRLRRSYELLLDFYGLRLLNNRGDLARAPHYSERFRHLTQSFHNRLRITRIIRCLGLLGRDDLQRGFVDQLVEESYSPDGRLPQLADCCRKYWIEALDSQIHRDSMVAKCSQYEINYNFRYRERRESDSSTDCFCSVM